MAAPGLTDTNAVFSLFAKRLDKRSEKTLFQNTVLYELGLKRPLPGAAGTTLFIPRHIARNSIRALTEGTVLTEICPTSAHYYSGTVAGYGDVKKYSDFLEKVREVPETIADDVGAMGMYLGYKYDSLCIGVLSNAGTWVSPDGATAVTDVEDTTTLKQRFLFDASTTLRNADAPTWEDGTYHGVFNPLATHDLFVSTSGTYGPIASASFLEQTEMGAAKLSMMRLGTLGRVTVIESTHSAKTLAATEGGMSEGATNTGVQSLVMGPRAFAVVDLDTARPRTYIKPFGSAGHADTIDQLMGVGIKGYFVAVAMDTSNRLVRTASGDIL